MGVQIGNHFDVHIMYINHFSEVKSNMCNFELRKSESFARQTREVFHRPVFSCQEQLRDAPRSHGWEVKM